MQHNLSGELSRSIYINTIFRLHIGHQKIWQIWPMLFYSFSLFPFSLKDNGSLIKTV